MVFRFVSLILEKKVVIENFPFLEILKVIVKIIRLLVIVLLRISLCGLTLYHIFSSRWIPVCYNNKDPSDNVDRLFLTNTVYPLKIMCL